MSGPGDAGDVAGVGAEVGAGVDAPGREAGPSVEAGPSNEAGPSGGAGSSGGTGASEGRTLRARKEDKAPAPALGVKKAPLKKRKERVLKESALKSWGHGTDSESDDSFVVRERKLLPWPIYFRRPRTWARWSVYRNEERALRHAHQCREQLLNPDAPPSPKFSNLVAPAQPMPLQGVKSLGRQARLRNPWRFATPLPGCPPMRLIHSARTQEQSLEEAVAQAEEERRAGRGFGQAGAGAKEKDGAGEVAVS